MKRLGIIFMAALLAAAPGFAGAPEPAQTSPALAAPSIGPEMKGGQVAQPAKTYETKEKEEYLEKNAAALEELQQRILELKGKAVKAGPQMKRVMVRASGTLTKKAIAARNKLAALESASDNDWSRLKAELERIMQDLTRACQEAESQLK